VRLIRQPMPGFGGAQPGHPRGPGTTSPFSMPTTFGRRSICPHRGSDRPLSAMRTVCAHFFYFRDDGSGNDADLGNQGRFWPAADRTVFEMWSHGIFFLHVYGVIPMRILPMHPLSRGRANGRLGCLVSRADAGPLDTWRNRWSALQQATTASCNLVLRATPPSHNAARRISPPTPSTPSRKAVRTERGTFWSSRANLLSRAQRRRAVKLLYDPSCLPRPALLLPSILAGAYAGVSGRQLSLEASTPCDAIDCCDEAKPLPDVPATVATLSQIPPAIRLSSDVVAERLRTGVAGKLSWGGKAC